MTILRRQFVKTLLALVATPFAWCQQVFRGWPWATLRFQTTHTVGFNPRFTKTGAVAHWAWGDGTYTDSNWPTKNYAAGTKTLWVMSRDGFRSVTLFDSPMLDFLGPLPAFTGWPLLSYFNCRGNQFTGALPSFDGCTSLSMFLCALNSGLTGSLPSFAACTALTYFDCDSCSFTGTLPSFAACILLDFFDCHSNGFTGTLPSFAACTLLTKFYCYLNAFSGTLPSFAANTLLQRMWCFNNSLTGTLPSFAACTLLEQIQCQNNGLTDVVAGSFATQASLAIMYFGSNSLTQAAIDQILADCVVSLGLPGRVVCQLFMAGGANATPSAAGLADKALLVAAGWTVTNN